MGISPKLADAMLPQDAIEHIFPTYLCSTSKNRCNDLFKAVSGCYRLVSPQIANAIESKWMSGVR